MQTTSSFTPRPPSTQARFAHWVTRHTIRPLEHVVPDGALGVQITRRVLAGLMAVSGRTAPGVAVVPVDATTRDFGHVRGEWLRPDGARPDAVILYIHGSGYNLCSTKTHRPLVSKLAALAGTTVFSAEYRLAPEHVFPAAADDIDNAYAWLLAQGWTADQVVVAGDSAGGHLTLDLALHLLREGRDLPAGLLMFSPLADLTCTLIASRDSLVPDAMISADGCRRLFENYLAGTDPRHPRLAHVIEEGEVLPPTLIQTGGAEFIAADAHHIADMLASTGTEVSLEVWPGQMHVFQAASRVVPEGGVALRRAARFVNDAHAAARSSAGRLSEQSGVIA